MKLGKLMFFNEMIRFHKFFFCFSWKTNNHIRSNRQTWQSLFKSK